MLSKFKIGVKLVAGFGFVLLLLLFVAVFGYFGLVQSSKTTDDALKTEGLLAEMLRMRRLVNTAQLISVNGSLFRDLKKEKDRMVIDNEIKEIADKVRGQLRPNNQEPFKKFEEIYENYKNNDNSWYRIEEKRADEQEKLREASQKAVEQLELVRDRYVTLMNEESTQNGEKTNYPKKRVDRAIQVENYLSKIQMLRTDYYRYMASKDAKEMNTILESLNKEIPKLINDLEVLRNDVDPERAPIIEQAKNAVIAWNNSLNECISLMQGQDAIDVTHDKDSGEIASRMNEIMANLNKRTEEIRDISSNTDAMMKLVITVVSIVALVAGFMISLVLSRDITGGLKKVLDCVLKIVQDGDLSVEIPPVLQHRGDEIGDLAKGGQAIMEDYRGIDRLANSLGGGDWRVMVKEKSSLDTMNQNLGKMLDQVNEALGEINESVKQVTTGAGEVSSAAQTLSSGAQESAASLEEITASMSEISSQTKANAQNASEARDLAQKATHAATDGQEAMKEMMEAMTKITDNSHEIQRVIKVIDDIAFQTNLLALNAAVEAARAGVHGKGFAVVAEEVRNLAARSSKAAAETNELISTSGSEIQRGGEVAAHTAEELNAIVEQIKQTTDLIAGIATASSEQAQGVAQVTVGLQQIDAVTQQNTAAAEESASAANEMSSMATNLQQLVAKFHLRN